MALPKDMEEVTITKPGWVVVDLYRLCMVAQTVVGGVLFGASRVPYAGTNDAVYDPEPGIRAPESPEGKGRGLRSRRSGRIYGRYRNRM
jgi:hypothetical protein